MGEKTTEIKSSPKIATQSVKWYQKAAEQGYAEAEFELGHCYATGEGVAKDKTAAARWYRRTAAQGISKAEAALKDLDL